jgi:hypothetical protein
MRAKRRPKLWLTCTQHSQVISLMISFDNDSIQALPSSLSDIHYALLSTSDRKSRTLLCSEPTASSVAPKSGTRRA